MGVLPPSASSSLISKLESGKKGISDIKEDLRKIDVENARAWKPEDEEQVKTHIRETLGFQNVNEAVAQSMMLWIGQAVRMHFDKILHAPSEAPSRGISAISRFHAPSEGPSRGISAISSHRQST